MAWSPTNITKKTQGEEFNNGNPIEGSSFTYTKCEECGTEVIAVKDDARNSHYGYLGNQAEIPKNYLASPSIEAIRKFYDVGWEEYNVEKRSNGLVFTQELGNNLYNVHSRLHVRKKGSKKLVGPWKHARGGKTYKILCNNCFKKTYKRISIEVRGGYIYDITVLPHETLAEVIREAGIPHIDPKTGKDPLVKN